MKFFPETKKKQIGTQMAPLIDVIFQLLIFFFLTTSFNIEKELTTPLPTAEEKTTTKSRLEEPIITIRITRDHRILIHKKEYDSPASEELPELRAMLTEYANFFKEPIIVLLPEKGVRYNRVVNVLDACAAAKITRISFASAPPRPE